MKKFFVSKFFSENIFLQKFFCKEIFFAALIIFIAVFANFLPPQDPYAQNLDNALLPPSSENFFGTDRYGRDIFSRIIAGSQTTLLATFFILFSVTIFGTFVGIVGGFFGGKIDTILMRLTDLFLAFPQMVFAIAVAGILGGGLFNAALAIIFIGWTKYARLSRSLVLQITETDFISAAEISGATSAKIIFQHILPNISGTILVTAALDIGTIIMEISGLSFLGLGAQPPTAEWGAMMNNGRVFLQTASWVILAPGAAIFITVAIFNLLGDKLRDLIDVK